MYGAIFVFLISLKNDIGLPTIVGDSLTARLLNGLKWLFVPANIYGPVK